MTTAAPMLDSKPTTSRLVLAFGIVYLIWGSTYLGIRFGIETIPPLLLGSIRFLLAGSVLFLWTRIDGVPFPKRHGWTNALTIGGLLLLGGNGFLSMAEKYVASSVAALVVATVPLWMALLEWWRPSGHRPSRQAVVGIVIGFLGVAYLVSGRESLGQAAFDMTGIGLLFVSTICWASGSLYQRHLHLSDSPIQAAGMQMLGGSLLLFLASTLTGEYRGWSIANVSPASLAALLYLTLFGSIVAFTAYVWLLRNTTPSRVATYAYVNPGVAVFLGWAIAGESLTARMLSAMGIILIGVIIITVARDA